MVIGISSPITIGEFLPYLDEESRNRATTVSGLFAPAVDALIHQFLHMGHSVVVFTLDKAVSRPLVLTGLRLKIYVGRYRPRARWRALTFFHAEVKTLKSFIRMEEARLEVLHAHWSYEFALATRGVRCPVFCTVRDVAEEIYRFKHDAYRLVRLLMNAVVLRQKQMRFIANSPYTERQLLEYHPTMKFMAMIPNPIGLPIPGGLDCVKHDSNSTIIVSVSNSIVSYKNLFKLLEAFAIVRQEMPCAELHLIGGCFVPNANLPQGFFADGIVLCGAIRHADLPKKFMTATLMVHPSLEESFGNVLLEAMACGVPVIGGEQSGAVPYVLDEGRAGVLCDVTDARALADAMLSLLRDSSRRSTLAQAGFERVRTDFLAESVAARTLQVYHEALS